MVVEVILRMVLIIRERVNRAIKQAEREVLLQQRPVKVQAAVALQLFV